MKKAFLMLLLCVTAVKVSAQTVDESSPSPGVSANRTEAIISSKNAINYNTDLFTGKFVYGVPIELPPGRNGCAPQLSLNYNSSGANGWCGVGWNLEVGYVERDTRRGVPTTASGAYDDSKGFVFSLKGMQGRLVRVPGTSNPAQYRAEVDEASLQFFYHSAGYWEAKDKSGNVYGFGQANGSRQTAVQSGTNFNPVSPDNGTFRWALDNYSDANGNTVGITYTKHLSQLYLNAISYNGNLNTGLINPCLIQFETENRSDITSTLMPGFKATTARRLKTITVHSGNSPVRKYVLGYAESASTKRSLLTQVQEFGRDNFVTSLPPLKFTYQGEKSIQSSFGPVTEWGPVEAESSHQYWDAPVVTGSDSASWTVAMMADMDGDGLPDRVFQKKNVPFDKYWVQLNTGSGFASKIEWGPLDNEEQSYVWNAWNHLSFSPGPARLSDFFDINGDGLPDRVMNATVGSDYTHWGIQTNTGSGFSSLFHWTTIQSEQIQEEDYWARSPSANHYEEKRGLGEKSSGVKTQDMNGDGLPDRVMSRRIDGATKSFMVQLNTGSSFAGMVPWGNVQDEGLYSWLSIDETYTHNVMPSFNNTRIIDLFDINGDGLPDRILAGANADVGTSLKVQLNDGNGFQNPVLWEGLTQAPANGTGVAAWYWGKVSATRHRGDWGEHLVTWADMNGDGLPDRVLRDWPSLNSSYSYNFFRVQLNTGSGFRPAINWSGVSVPAGETHKPGRTSPRAWAAKYGEFRNEIADLIDINGDGLPDRVMSSKNGDKFLVQLNQTKVPDLLVTIDNGIGGSVRIKYVPVNKSNGGPTKHRIPFPMHVVSTIDTYDGTKWYDRTEYRYIGGWHDSLNREFNGFAQVTVYEPMKRATITYFHQAGARRGKSYQVDTYNTAGGGAEHLKRTLSKVQQAPTRDDNTGSYFPFISRSITIDYASPTKYKATGRDFHFNRYNGNVTGTVGYGEVIHNGGFEISDINAGDNHYATNIYEPNTKFTRRILDRVRQTDEASNGSFSSASLLRRTYYRYDSRGNVLTKKRWLRDGTATGQYAVEQSTYDAYGNLETSLNPVNIATVTEYDDATHTFPKKTTMGGSFIEEFTYDVRSGQLLWHTDVKGLKSRFFYDPFFRLTEVQVGTTPNAEPSLWVEKFGYHFDGMGVSFDASRNYIVHQVNDATGSNGHESYTYFDGYGRPIQKRVEGESEWRVTDTFYNARGELIFSTLPRFDLGFEFTKDEGPYKGTTYSHDTLGRVVAIIPAEVTISDTHAVATWMSVTGDPGSPTSQTSTSYIWNGTNPWVQTTTDPKGKQKMLVYDGFGRVAVVKEKSGSEWFTTRYTYSQVGELLTIKDHHGNVRTFRYDTLGRKTRETHPNTGTLSYTYDLAGKIIEQATPTHFSSPKGGGPRKLKMFYNDPIGRITKKEAWESGALESVIQYTYDTGTTGYTVYKGQLASMTDSEGWEKYSYDVRGRLLSKTRYLDLATPQTFTISRTYDDANRVKTLTYPGGASILHEYDNGGNLYRIKTVSGFGAAKTIYQANSFSAMGHILDASYGNNVRTTYGYYSESKRLANVRTYLDSGGTPPADYRNVTYQYDTVGNVKSIIDSRYLGADASESLLGAAYDDLHRLTYVETPQGVKRYSYSPIGNFVVNGEAGTAVHKFLTSGKPHAVSAANGKAYVYDNFGNVIIQKVNGLTDAEYTYSYVYDAQNRMTRVYHRNLSQVVADISYGYDWAGKRLWKHATYHGPNGTTIGPGQIWIGELFEIKDGKNLCHVHANGKQVATLEPGTATDRVSYYYHGDYLGSTSVLTDDTGAVVQRYVNTAYGKQRYQKSESAFPVSNRYTGMPLDEDTGLYYYGFRYYSPALGMFIQPDTVIPDLYNPQSFNPYGYALYNPLRYTDPTGHAGAEVARWWSATVDAKFQCLMQRYPENWVLNGFLGTANSIAGGLADPLALGSDAGRVSVEGGSAFDIAAVTVTELGRAAAIVPGGAVVGKVGGEIAETAGDLMKAKGAGKEALETMASCFVAGTLVWTERGCIPIKDVATGDLVWSYSIQSQEWELQTVTETYVRNYFGDIITISIGGETIEATGDHPFWVAFGHNLSSRPLATEIPEADHPSTGFGRWVDARALYSGDVVSRLISGNATINSLAAREEKLLVYNLQVATNHTYAVSLGGILVHNRGMQIKPIPKAADLAKQDAIRDMRLEGIDVDPVTGEFRGGEGIIYEVPGSGTPSGKPYIGSADDFEVRTKTAKDGRDRTQGYEVGRYPRGDIDARRTAEQSAMEDRGGIGNLDNKRNETRKK